MLSSLLSLLCVACSVAIIEDVSLANENEVVRLSEGELQRADVLLQIVTKNVSSAKHSTSAKKHGLWGPEEKPEG